ncbi:MAG: hypothetical protein O6761_08405 [Thaumarchaeota archaeon]|nr:hypothetical protein [Nitrososphaerota archaeon]
MTPIHAEGGGGIECPESSGVYTYVSGSASYTVNPFDEGNLGVLFCEYETESEDEGIEPFGEINAVYHISGELSQDLIEEYGCGAILGEQFSPVYVSSTTNFASVAFSTAPLIEAAAEIMTQIEEENLATVCTLETIDESGGGSTSESVKETIQEHEVIEDTSIEVSNEEINEESIEIIKEKIKEEQKIEKKIYVVKTLTSETLLPDWIKNNAQWWSTDQITSDDFSLGIEFMIKEGFIKVPATEAAAEKSSEIPDWVKNNAGWWSEGLISDDDFVNGLQFLISNGIIGVT